MARGKQTCKILKEIRRQIAEAIGIEFATSECRYKGDCRGTCPKCEAEVRYLEQQLRARSLAGKAVALAGISAGVILMSGCNGASTSRPTETLQSEPELPTEQIVVADTVKVAEDSIPKDSAGVQNPQILDLLLVGDVDEPSEDLEDILEEGEIPPFWDESEVDVKPQFPGGKEAMQRFLDEGYKNEKDTVFGDVTIGYVVDFTGRVENPEIIHGNKLLGEQLIRIIKQFPNHIPGKRKGHEVSVYMKYSMSMVPDEEVDTIK